MKEKSIWRQKSGWASSNACSLAQKVGSRCPACPIGSAANGPKPIDSKMRLVKLKSKLFY